MSLEEEKLEIRKAVSNLPQNTRRRFSAELRSAIMAYASKRVADGAPITRVAKELGIGAQVITNAQRAPAPFLKVRLRREQAQQEAVRVVVDGSIAVEGLTAENAAAFVRSLR